MQMLKSALTVWYKYKCRLAADVFHLILRPTPARSRARAGAEEGGAHFR